MAAPNAPPFAEDDAYATTEDIAEYVVDAPSGVLANDSDPENDPLTAVLVAGPASGSVSLSPDGSFTYVPDPDFNGLDSFTYEATDGGSSSNVATVTITVSPVNDAPVAVDDAYTAETGASLVVSAAEGVLANDTDVDVEDVLSATVVSEPSLGTLTLSSDGSFTYTPGGSLGADSFVYEASDGNGGTAQATATIAVTAPNLPPVATDDAYSTDEDTQLTVDASSGVLANDDDPEEQPLTAVLATGPSNGSLTLNPDGSFTYMPGTDFHGDDTFTYVANDGIEDSDPATVSITVNPVNDAPVAADDAYETAQDTPLGVAAPGVLGNDTDVDGGALTAAVVDGPTSGALTLNSDGSFTYTPDAGFTGTDSFTYAASDGTASSAPATVTILVTGGAQPISVASIEMGLVPTGKNTKGEARVTVSPAIAEATVTGTWTLNGALLVEGTSGVTDASGVAVIHSVPEKVKSGDVLAFTVTDIVAVGYVYDPGSNLETTDSIQVQP
jgi:VCBS repeat-containing protein